MPATRTKRLSLYVEIANGVGGELEIDDRIELDRLSVRQLSWVAEIVRRARKAHEESPHRMSSEIQPEENDDGSSKI
jgi:hypothetical protein